MLQSLPVGDHDWHVWGFYAWAAQAYVRVREEAERLPDWAGRILLEEADRLCEPWLAVP